MRRCNHNIRKTLNLVDEMIRVADKGDIEREDNGCGIPKSRQSTIFELNYTTKKVGNFGLGIGLSICQQIVAAHNGWIDVQSELNNYTRMTVWLPVIEEGDET